MFKLDAVEIASNIQYFLRIKPFQHLRQLCFCMLMPVMMVVLGDHSMALKMIPTCDAAL